MTLPDTKLLIDHLLGDEYCLIHVNPTVSGVVVPDNLRKEPTVTMKLSHYFAGSVFLRDDRIEADLRFGSLPFNCQIPYEAVWAVSSMGGELTIWEDRALHASLAKMLRESMPAASQAPAARPQLKQVVSDHISGIPEESAAIGEKKRPSFLKRVK